MDVIILKY